MDTNIFSHKMRYKFVINSLFANVLFAKRIDRTLMGCSRPNFSPKLEPIHRTK